MLSVCGVSWLTEVKQSSGGVVHTEAPDWAIAMATMTCIAAAIVTGITMYRRLKMKMMELAVKDEETYRTALRRWQETWYCQRCGTVFTERAAV